MKKRVKLCLLILCLAIGFLGIFAEANTTVYFTAINDKLLELSDDTMPIMENGIVYVPVKTVFNNSTLKVYYQYYRTTQELCLYSGSKELYFNMSTGIVYDENGDKQGSYKALYRNSQYYVPGAFAANFFDLNFSVISAEPASIVRVKSDAVILSDSDFASSASPLMQSRYKQYIKSLETTVTASPSPTPSNAVSTPAPVTPSSPPSSTSSPPSSGVSSSPNVSTTPEVPTYEDVEVYLSFEGISETYTPQILDALASYGYKSIFYLTAEEIAGNADLIRLIICSGHSIGIMVDESLSEDYAEASAKLLAAARIKTLFVTSNSITAELAEEASGLGLLLWGAAYNISVDDVSVSPVINNISNANNRSDLRFTTGENTASVLTETLSYLNNGKYDVRRVTELETPYTDVIE